VVQDSSLEIIFRSHLKQFLIGEYSTVKCSGTARMKKNYFESNFVFDITDEDAVRMAFESVVVEWMKAHDDNRYELYFDEYNLPDEAHNLSEFSIADLINFIVPHNIDNG